MIILISFLVACLITVITIPFTIKLAEKWKLLDDPKKRSHPAHIQTRIIPRAGGLPIFLGITIPTLLFLPLDKHILGILSGALILLVVGLLDDYLKYFSPYKRWLLQFLAAAAVVTSGVGISFITNPFGGILRLDEFIYPIYFFGNHNIVLIADIFAFLWIVWMMNVINWANGIDGQTPGIIGVSSLILGFYSLNLYQNGDPNQLSIATLSFITAGTATGFLPFNWHPAKIFLGFSGTTILGFLIATLSILSGAKLAIAFLVLLIPALDFFYTFTRRILSKKSPFLGDKKHLHHLLLSYGWSHQKISLFYIFSCAILGVLAITLPSEGKIFTILALGVTILASLIWLHMLGRSFGQSDRDSG